MRCACNIEVQRDYVLARPGCRDIFQIRLFVIVWGEKYGGDVTCHVSVLGYVAGQDISSSEYAECIPSSSRKDELMSSTRWNTISDTRRLSGWHVVTYSTVHVGWDGLNHIKYRTCDVGSCTNAVSKKQPSLRPL